MAKYYPHKQTVLIAIICTLIVICTLVYIRPQILIKNNSLSNVEIKAVNEEQKNTISDVSNTDWRKAFLTTSSTTSVSTKTSNGSTKNTTEEKLTLTDQLSRDFFTRYVELKKNNLSEDNESVQKIVDQTLNTTINSASQPKIYNLSHLTIIEDTSSNTTHSYGNNIGTVFSKDGPRADPVMIVSDALEKGDMNLLKNIKPIITSYDKMIRAVIATPVPRPLANYHLNLVNSLSSMLFVTQGLEKVSTDPVQSMLAIKLYTPTQEAIRLALLSMNSYFNTNRVYFTNNEPGILFVTVPQ
ncbi:MAG: hypothetical protein WCS89_02895 [Candidatus Paceibacterota bacterium]